MSRKFIINNLVSFEPEKKIISGQKRSVNISTSASYCFEFMINKAGELVTHEELYQFAWRQFGIEPTSASLYQNISNLRRALRLAGIKEEIIRTMPRRGFLVSPLIDITKPGSMNELEGSVSTVDSEPKGIYDVIDTELTNEELVTENKVKKVISGGAKKFYFAMLMIFVISILIVFFILYKLNPGSGYLKIASALECQVYMRENSKLEGGNITNFILRNRVPCNLGDNLYISTTKNSSRLSVFNCSKELENPITECVSYYYTWGIDE